MLSLSLMSIVAQGQNLAINGSMEEFRAGIALPPSPFASFWPFSDIYYSEGVPPVGPRFGHSAYNNVPQGTPSFAKGMPRNIYGHQFARTGKGYVWIGINKVNIGDNRYIIFPLSKPLEKGKQYCARFYVSRTDHSSFATDAIHGYFSKDSITLDYFWWADTANPHIINPHGVIADTANWTVIEGSYIAKGGEKNFVVGNLYMTRPYQYYIIDTIYYGYLGVTDYDRYATYYTDDIAVWECGAPEFPADAGKDVVICKGDSVEIGAMQQMDQYLYFWSESPWSSPMDDWDTLATTPKITVSPDSTTTYYLRSVDFKWDNTYDAITVIVDDCLQELTIPNVFTPNGDGYNDLFIPENNYLMDYSVTIFNRWGSIVFEGNHEHFWDGTNKGQLCPDGVYYYVLLTSNRSKTERKEYSGSITILR